MIQVEILLIVQWREEAQCFQMLSLSLQKLIKINNLILSRLLINKIQIIKKLDFKKTIPKINSRVDSKLKVDSNNRMKKKALKIKLAF